MKRRGERLRRRRRATFATLAALALVLPATALATFVGGSAGDRNVNLAVAGPPPTGEVAGPTTGAGDAPAMPTEETTTTTAEPQPRIEGGPGRTEPATPASSVPADDPVLRRPPATNPAPSPGNSSSGPDTPISSEPALQAPPPAAPPSTAPAAANCPSSGVRVTVTTERTAYAPGETVQGTATIENRSASACLLPTRAFVRIMSPTGRQVSGFAYTMDYRLPVLAEPGRTFTSPFTWDQQDCTGAPCVQVPPGTYNIAADWTEGGQYFGRGSFTIGG